MLHHGCKALTRSASLFQKTPLQLYHVGIESFISAGLGTHQTMFYYHSTFCCWQGLSCNFSPFLHNVPFDFYGVLICIPFVGCIGRLCSMTVVFPGISILFVAVAHSKVVFLLWFLLLCFVVRLKFCYILYTMFMEFIAVNMSVDVSGGRSVHLFVFLMQTPSAAFARHLFNFVRMIRITNVLNCRLIFLLQLTSSNWGCHVSFLLCVVII